MIVKEHFDVIVVGSDLAPLLCAALLCKRGFRVLVVGAGEVDRDEIPAVTGQLGTPLARRILGELGIAQIVRRNEHPLDPPMQIITPGSRISVYREPEKLLGEFTREHPAEREAARVFYERLAEAMGAIDHVLESGLGIPPRGFIEKQRVKRLLGATEFGYDGLGGRLMGALSDAPGLRACINTQVVPGSRLDRSQIAPVHAALLHGRAVTGQVSLHGGIKGLCELLVQRISNSRGEAKLEDRIEYVEVSKNRIQHVKLLGHESATGCDFLVSGIEAPGLVRILRTEGRLIDDPPFEPSDVTPVSHLATMKLILKNEAFPEPMADLVYALFDDRRAPSGDNLAVIERGTAVEDGSVGLWVSFLVEHERLLAEPGHVKQMAGRVRINLRRVIPFLDDFVLEVRDPVTGLETSSADDDLVELVSRHLPAIYKSLTPGPWGVCGFDYATAYRNLLMCSAQVLPGLGAEGLWLAAWGAAGLVASRDPTKARFRSRTQKWSM